MSFALCATLSVPYCHGVFLCVLYVHVALWRPSRHHCKRTAPATRELVTTTARTRCSRNLAVSTPVSARVSADLPDPEGPTCTHTLKLHVLNCSRRTSNKLTFSRPAYSSDIHKAESAA